MQSTQKTVNAEPLPEPVANSCDRSNSNRLAAAIACSTNPNGHEPNHSALKGDRQDVAASQGLFSARLLRLGQM